MPSLAALLRHYLGGRRAIEALTHQAVAHRVAVAEGRTEATSPEASASASDQRASNTERVAVTLRWDDVAVAAALMVAGTVAMYVWLAARG